MEYETDETKMLSKQLKLAVPINTFMLTNENYRVARCLTKQQNKPQRMAKQTHTEHSPGSFFVRNDAFVIIDFDTVTVDVAGVSATLMPIGPSLG